MKDEIRDLYYAYDEHLKKKFWGFELGSINELLEDEKYISWPIYFLFFRILKIPTTLKLKIDKKTNYSPILPPSREFDRIKSANVLNPDNIMPAFYGFLKSPLDKNKFQITSPLDVHRYLHETFKVFLSSKYDTIAFKNNPNFDNERKIRKRISEIKTTILDKFDTKIIAFDGRELIERPSIADHLALMDLANVRMLYGAYFENSTEKTSPNQAIIIALKIYEALLDNVYYPFYQVLDKIEMENLNKLNLATLDELSPEYVDFLIDEQNGFLDIKTSLPKHKKIISALSGFSYYLYFMDIWSAYNKIS